MKCLVLVLASIVLCACATTKNINGVHHFIVPDEVKASLTDAKTTNGGFENFKYADLAINKSKSVEITSESDAYEFETGKSYYLAFTLPNSIDEAYSVIVKSYFSGPAFFPSVLTLDKNFEIIKRASDTDFNYENPTMFERGRVEGTVVFPKGSKERYLVILTTNEAMEKIRYSSESGYSFSTAGGANYVSGATYANHYGPVGKLKIELEIAE